MDEIRWPAPVRPGNTLYPHIEVMEVRPSKSRPDRGLAKLRVTTLNARDEPVQVPVANLRPAPNERHEFAQQRYTSSMDQVASPDPKRPSNGPAVSCR